MFEQNIMKLKGVLTGKEYEKAGYHLTEIILKAYEQGVLKGRIWTYVAKVELSVFSLLKINEMREVTQKYFSVSDLNDSPTWENIKHLGDNLRVENCQMVAYKDVFNYTCNIKNSGIKLYTEDICYKDI